MKKSLIVLAVLGLIVFGVLIGASFSTGTAESAVEEYFAGSGTLEEEVEARLESIYNVKNNVPQRAARAAHATAVIDYAILQQEREQTELLKDIKAELKSRN